MGLNGLNQVLIYADAVNLFGEYINTTRNNTDVFLQASKEVGLEVNIDKTKYTNMTQNQNH